MSEVGQAFSRRTFLQGSAAVAGISLVGLPELLQAPPGAIAAPTSTALPSGYAAPTTPTGVALPMLSDALNFSRPECYETIQSGRRPNNRMHQKADLDGDGQDELIARGSGGILAYRFDPGTGQWWSLRNGPAWSDDRGWARNNHFATIQTADLDGDGRAELIGWGPAGIEVYRYVSDAEGWSDLGVANPITQKNFEAPFYSGTMQCADIDGDGRDELLVRFSDGLHVWKLDGTAWTKMPTLTVMSDTNGWDLMSRFPTIQCADLDLTGAAWVLGRDAAGLHAWKYANGDWTEPHPVLTDLKENDTSLGDVLYDDGIQCADLTGFGSLNLLARVDQQLRVWQHRPSGWEELAPGAGPMLTDANGWSEPQYTTTIQTARLAGGHAMVFARAWAGIVVWEFTGAEWIEFEAGHPAWSDDNGWDRVQYYSTIQTARVRTSDDETNPHVPANQSGTVDVLIGRSALAIETYCMQSDGDWAETSAPWPTLDAGAYAAAAIALRLTDGRQVRDLYGLDRDLDRDASDLDSPVPPPPAEYTGSLGTWTATCTQLAIELRRAGGVNGWYTNVNHLITQTSIGDDLSLQAVAASLQLKDTSKTSLALSIISMLANAAASALTLGDFDVASCAAGFVSSAFGAGAAATGGASDAAQNTIANLDEELSTRYQAALDESADQSARATKDYGLMTAIAEQIASANLAWSWSEPAQNAMSDASQRSFNVSACQALVIPVGWKWSVWGLDVDVPRTPYEQYLTNGWLWATVPDDDPESYYCGLYTLVQGTYTLIDDNPLTLVVGPSNATITSYSVPVENIIAARHGWPRLGSAATERIYTGCSDVAAPWTFNPDADTTGTAVSTLAAGTLAAGTAGAVSPTVGSTFAATAAASGKTTARGGKGTPQKPDKPNPPRPLGVDLALRVRLERDAIGEIVARIDVANYGLSPAEEAEISVATLGGRAPRAHSLPTRPRVIDDGEELRAHLRYSDMPGKPGKQVPLKATVRYRGGEFSDTLLLQLP